MKKLSLWIIGIIGISAYGTSFAYTPNSGDLASIAQLKTTLTQITSGNAADTRNFSQQIKSLQPQITGNDKISYILNELSTQLSTQFGALKTKAKQSNKPTIQQFLSLYNTGIIDTHMIDNCIGRYNTIDNISFANNFPTALSIAIRYRESHCGYYLPKNGDGPFQILSKDYGTGDITPELFSKTIQDFIDFSKIKYGNYKSKIGSIFTYTGFDTTRIVNFAALYNGGTISGNKVLPNNPKYVYEGYESYASGAVRHGILPKFIKTLERELNNNY